MLAIVQIWYAQKQELAGRVGATSRRIASKVAPTLRFAACCNAVADQPAAIRRQCSGSGARCRSRLLRPGNDQSAKCLDGGRANLLRACRDNRPATGERRERGLMQL